MFSNRHAAIAICCAVVATLAPAGAAQAKGGTAVTRAGACSAGAHWTLKAKHDDGRIELELEVDSNRRGQTWRVRVRDNGALVVATRGVTAGRSGSFTVHRLVANRAGADHLVAGARDLGSGQTCVGRVTV